MISAVLIWVRLALISTCPWLYCPTDRLYTYLGVVENRLFSEGLHVLGMPPSRAHMGQYLGAYFGDDMPTEAVEAVAGVDGTRLHL